MVEHRSGWFCSKFSVHLQTRIWKKKKKVYPLLQAKVTNTLIGGVRKKSPKLWNATSQVTDLRQG